MMIASIEAVVRIRILWEGRSISHYRFIMEGCSGDDKELGATQILRPNPLIIKLIILS